MQFESKEHTHNQVVAGYVRCSPGNGRSTYSLEAQKRAIRETAIMRGLPEPRFYTDQESSARGSQLLKRPAFKMLLDDIQAGHIQVVMVYSLDRWARNVLVALQSFRLLARQRVAFISLCEQIDYSTPEGQLQLTILAAFAAYYSDMVARHTSKSQNERAVQGLYHGHLPFGYRSTDAKSPPEFDPTQYSALRLIGELRMRGDKVGKIASEVNAAGYRIESREHGSSLFTGKFISALLRNEFYAAYAPGDERGTVKYREQRYRGLHPALFTCDEWQQIRSQARMQVVPVKGERQEYIFAGVLSCIRCGLPLHTKAQGRTYRDSASKRRSLCPIGGNVSVSDALVSEQFGSLLQSLALPTNWLEALRLTIVERAYTGPLTSEMLAREKERLRLKQAYTRQKLADDYLANEDFQGELASLALALQELDQPSEAGVTFAEMYEAGEHISGMIALWEVATLEERRTMAQLLLEPGGLCYDLELQMIAAFKPRSSFVPLLRLFAGPLIYRENSGLLLTRQWLSCQERS